MQRSDHVLSWSASKEVAYLGGVDGGGGGRSSLIHMDPAESGMLFDKDPDESGMQSLSSSRSSGSSRRLTRHSGFRVSVEPVCMDQTCVVGSR